jgi:hypothetical protein
MVMKIQSISSLRWALSAVPCIVLAGCQTMVTITPQLTAKDTSACQIHAQVRYDGKAEYLPGALGADPSAPDPVVFHYAYEAQYGLNEFPPGVNLVNPLLLFGFPTGSDNVVVTGRLDLIRGDTTLRSYAAAVAMKRSGTVFSEGETFTEMRRRGLLLVRDNLSSQICKDQAVLVALLHDSPANAGAAQ